MIVATGRLFVAMALFSRLPTARSLFHTKGLMAPTMLRCQTRRDYSSLSNGLVCTKWNPDERASRRSRLQVTTANLDGDAAARDPRGLAEETFSKLAKRGRSWRRLRHLVDLASESKGAAPIHSIADIGCDHGLLSMGLALSGRFQHVIGVDVSDRALQDGAIALHEQLLNNTSILQGELPTILPVEFRVGDGLRVLHPGEADAVCVAGMGVNTMIGILDPAEVDHVGCKKLILQPTNSRPRNLMRLYDHLTNVGWTATAERIEYLSSRWYLSSLFERGRKAHASSLPGQLLARLDEETSMKNYYDEYVQHHQEWLERDSQRGPMDENDKRWLNSINS